MVAVSAEETLHSVREFSSRAGEDIGTSTDHVACKGELLAVKNECISVLSEASLAVSALFLQSLDSVSLVIDFVVVLIDTVVVSTDVIVIVFNIVCVLVNVVLESINVVVKVDEGLSDGFKSDHKFSLSLDSFFVFSLLPDWFPFVEVVNLVPEITHWDISVNFIWVVL